MFANKSTFLTIAALLILAMPTGPAAAGFVTHTISTSQAQRTTDFRESLAIPAFDASLGTLQNVAISMAYSGNFRGRLTNNSATAQTFRVTEVVHLDLALGLTTILGADLTAEQTYDSLAAGAGSDFGAYSPSGSVGPLSFASGGIFDAFRASTTGVILDFSTLTRTVTRGGGGNLSSAIFTTAGAEVTIRYDYVSPPGGETQPPPVPVPPLGNAVPEPASLVMAALGGILAVATRMARRRSIDTDA